MEIYLSNQEHVIKSWDYAQTKSKKDTTQSNLTITNKRVISTTVGKKLNSRTEIDIANITSFSGSFSKPKSLLAILIACILMTVVLLVMSFLYDFLSIGVPLGAVTLLFGVLVFAFNVNKCKFELEINTAGVSNVGMSIFANNPISNSGFFKLFKRKGNEKIRVRINQNYANEILDTLGTLVFNSKTQE